MSILLRSRLFQRNFHTSLRKIQIPKDKSIKSKIFKGEMTEMGEWHSRYMWHENNPTTLVLYRKSSSEIKRLILLTGVAVTIGCATCFLMAYNHYMLQVEKRKRMAKVNREMYLEQERKKAEKENPDLKLGSIGSVATALPDGASDEAAVKYVWGHPITVMLCLLAPLGVYMANKQISSRVQALYIKNLPIFENPTNKLRSLPKKLSNAAADRSSLVIVSHKSFLSQPREYEYPLLDTHAVLNFKKSGTVAESKDMESWKLVINDLEDEKFVASFYLDQTLEEDGDRIYFDRESMMKFIRVEITNLSKV